MVLETFSIWFFVQIKRPGCSEEKYTINTAECTVFKDLYFRIIPTAKSMLDPKEQNQNIASSTSVVGLSPVFPVPSVKFSKFVLPTLS